MRKLFYDQKKKNQQYEELRKSYEQLYQECNIVKQQNEKIMAFLKQKLKIKQQYLIESFQTSPRALKSGKPLLSFTKYHHKSSHQKQRNTRSQYTIDELLLKINNEWANLMKKAIDTKDVKNTDGILPNTSHSLNIVQQEAHSSELEEQKKQIQRITKENADLREELTTQKTRFETQKKKNQEVHSQTIIKLQTQNKMLRQQISDLRAEFQAQDRKLQAVLKIVNQKSHSFLHRAHK